MNLVALFFAGAFLCNSLPHLVCAVQGQPFPSPFAKPSGIGNSSPLVNFVWGFGNLLAGLAIASRFPLSIGLNANFVVLMAGAAAIGLQLSWHFGKVMRTRAAK